MEEDFKKWWEKERHNLSRYHEENEENFLIKVATSFNSFCMAKNKELTLDRKQFEEVKQVCKLALSDYREKKELVEDDTTDKYLLYKDLVLSELIEDAEEEKEEAEHISNLFESKMLDGGERQNFMKHLIKSEEKIDTINTTIKDLRKKRIEHI